jgi:hypothetical protein
VPTRLLLEGRDLEELLAQVRDEHGPDAKIVSAEKIRSGGIGGLFGHPKYELTVEIQDSAPSSAPSAPTVATLTIDDLAAMADAAEAREQTAEEPKSTEAFAEMLAEAADSPVARPRPPQSQVGGVVTQPNRAAPGPLNELLANQTGSGQGEDATPSVRPFRPNAGQNVAKLGVKPIGAAPVKPEPTPTRQETSMPVEEAVATIERPRTGDSSERLAATYTSSAAGPYTTAAAAPKERAIEKKANGNDRNVGLPRRLQSLGVPTDIAFRATGSDTYESIVEAFNALPSAEPAPDGPGETLVVIGESTHAVEVCRHVAAQLRLEADDILFAGRNAVAAGITGRRRIAGAHDARIWAKRLRKNDSSSLVAVEAALDESTWAASIVEAIRPVAVWVVVDASRKTSDVAHHLQGLRRVDAIALRSTLSSGDPASPLSLRLPVALLDGRPPTAYAWAAMLCERLSLVGA